MAAPSLTLGLSRSLLWKRRPQAAELLTALKNPHRGFEAVVVGGPHRAFHGNQFGLTFPVLMHYGVQLWMPEVGGPIDPDSEAHDLIMSVFGGMSKGERNRIKVRVHAAMGSQTKIEGRFLGGRPPYGYLIADAGPHPNPAKAADGRRLHRLEPDPAPAPVVQRIYREHRPAGSAGGQFLHRHGGRFQQVRQRRLFRLPAMPRNAIHVSRTATPANGSLRSAGSCCGAHAPGRPRRRYGDHNAEDAPEDAAASRGLKAAVWIADLLPRQLHVPCDGEASGNGLEANGPCDVHCVPSAPR
jgi:DNA invertase Pin-like site-specific DNA recombinase